MAQGTHMNFRQQVECLKERLHDILDGEMGHWDIDCGVFETALREFADELEIE